MKILAVGAHPDDIEIFMLGLLLACKNRGDDIHTIVATDGSNGNVLTSNNLKSIRSIETKKALQGISNPKMLNFIDGRLSSEKDVEKILQNNIKNINPDLIITHAPEDYHPDHRALSNYITNSVGFSYPIIYCDTLMCINFVPDYYIDITDFFEQKKQSIMCHKTQYPEKFVKATEIMNGFRASQCNQQEGSYAETYRKCDKFPFTDLRYLLPEPPKIQPFYNGSSSSLI